MGDLISRQAAIKALWKALYGYEDKMEKQFQESEELDVADWILHRIFVQNMSDIDRQAILNMPSAEPEPEPCEDAVSRKLMYELGATCMARRDENGELIALGRLDMLPSAEPDFDITVKIDKAYDDGYEAGYLQGRHDWGDLDE